MTIQAWTAGTIPKNPMDENSMALKARNFPVESVGERSVTMVKMPMAVIPPR